LKKLEAERDKLDDAIEARAKDAFAKRPKPTRPKMTSTGTDEPFAVEARYLKFVIHSLTSNHQGTAKGKREGGRRSGKLTEFQVWSAERTARNVALASNGTTAEGANSAAPRTSRSIRPPICIDGMLGAKREVHRQPGVSRAEKIGGQLPYQVGCRSQRGPRSRK